MRHRTPSTVSRRRFLGRTLAVAAAAPLVPALASPVVAEAIDHAAGRTMPALPSKDHLKVDPTSAAATYRSLTASEAAFTEAMVIALCPADALTPDGVTSGLAAFIDAHLAGDIDAGAPGQRELFRAGLVAADAACLSRYGVPFATLPADRARTFLRDLRTGAVPATFPLAAWAAEIVDPLLKQACFSGSIYAQYDGRMFWKLFG